MASTMHSSGRPMSHLLSRSAVSRSTVALLVGALVALLGAPALAVEEVYVYHLLVRSRAEAEKALEEVVNAGISRESFITVARKYSMDHPTKGSGGDLGWNTRRKFVPEFADAAFDTEVGLVSEPVRSQYGWHLIYVKEKRDLAREKQETENKPATPPIPTPPSGDDDPHAGHDHATPPPQLPNPIGDTPPVAPTPTPRANTVPQPATARPIQRTLPARQLKLSIEMPRRDVAPTVPLEVDLVLENRGGESLKVFHPDLLPLGLTVRTDTTPESPPASWDGIADPAVFVVDLASRSMLGGSYVINDYFKDLPANCRLWISWDAETFTQNFEKRFPGKAAVIDGYAMAAKSFPASNPREFATEIKGLDRHNEWVFKSKKEIPAAIFEPVVSTGRYFAKMTIQREASPVWFELFTKDQRVAAQHFITLAREGFYDGLRLFDIQKGDYIQGGCPKNDGTGVPDRTRPLANSAGISHEKGVLSLITRLRPQSRGGREAGSIFFICRKDHKEFDEIHVPIGKIVQGEDVLDRIEERSTNWVNVETISIVTEARAPASITGATPSVATAGGDAGAASGTAGIVNRPELPRVRIRTSKGDMVAELYEDDARNTVANFIDLTEKGFFNPDPENEKAPLQIIDKQAPYYVRTGSPDNSDSGGPGYKIASEMANNTRGHDKGTLSMCLDTNTNGQPIPNTAGSQFFICLDEVSYWNGRYTPFGKVIEGLDVLANLEKGDTIQSVEVVQKRAGLYKPSTQPR